LQISNYIVWLFIVGERYIIDRLPIAIAFGDNLKAQMATKAMFQLVHTHGDDSQGGGGRMGQIGDCNKCYLYCRVGENILDCVLHLFRGSAYCRKRSPRVEGLVDAKAGYRLFVSPSQRSSIKVDPIRVC